MVPGLGGHLISEAFLESQIFDAPGSERRGASRLGNAQHSLAHASIDPEAARWRLAAWRRRCRALGPASSVRMMLEVGAAPLVEILGFGPPAPGPGAAYDGMVHQPSATAEALTAVIHAGSAPVGLMVVPWGERLDPLWRAAVLRSRHRGAAWCVQFNGIACRIVDADRLYARRFVEFDLDLAVEDDRAFAAFWWLMRADRFVTLEEIVRASDQHASAVCRSLKDGVLAASTAVLGALVGSVGARSSARVGSLIDTRQVARTGPIGADDRLLRRSLEQSLTVVYRLLFLLFAEARGLMPVWHPNYRESYSLEALRAAAEDPRGAVGLWETVRALTRLAHAGCVAGDLRITPFNGRLFEPALTPLADRRELDDEAVRRAIVALSTRPAGDRAGRERITYRDLGVEQLGAVYETLLDYQPRLHQGSGSMSRRVPRMPTVTLEPGSGLRKSTGTFYTPQPIADYLVRRTLGPLLRGADPDRILSLRVLDPAMGSGAFLVAACRYLAGAYESALVRTGRYRSGELDEIERAAIRRRVAERCLYGVDLNPMAVQLARLSLWLTTLASDRPLTFLDHHLRVGDSLIGAWMTCLRQAPVQLARGVRGISGNSVPAGASTLPLFEDAAVRDVLRDVVPVRFDLELVPGDTLDQVRTKERAFAALTRRDSALSRWKRIADVWCAVWFGSSPERLVPPEAFGALSDTILTGRGALPAPTADEYLRNASAIAAERRFFHWELEFPEVFFGRDGEPLRGAGFDAVIGNPPWDMIRADNGSSDGRERSRADTAAVLRFTRDTGIYTAQSDGHANRYQLFLERTMALARSGGRIGLVLPSGLATDQGSAALRARLLYRCAVDALVSFDNARRVFPIHRSVRFLLVTATSGPSSQSIACRLGERDPSVLEALSDVGAVGDGTIAAAASLDGATDAPVESADARAMFSVRLTPALIERISGPDLTIPEFRMPIDVAIVERAAALFPPLGSDAGWGARFGRELNATEDRHWFHELHGARSDDAPVSGLPQTRGRGEPDAAAHRFPIVEGKQLSPFRVNLHAARYGIGEAQLRTILQSKSHERARLAYRDVASATNRLTLIAAVLPPGCVSTHTVFCLRTVLTMKEQYFLSGLFNSFVVNYLVRPRVTTHVTTATVERLPIPTRDEAPGVVREIAALARRLSGAARPGSSEASRLSMSLWSARLQARVAALYRLTEAEFAHVLDTFPLVDQAERDAALRRHVTGA